MGASQSKQQDDGLSFDEKSAVLLQDAEVRAALVNLRIGDDRLPVSADGSLTYGELKDWEKEAVKVRWGLVGPCELPPAHPATAHDRTRRPSYLERSWITQTLQAHSSLAMPK